MLRKYFFKRVRSYFFIMMIPTFIMFIVIGYFIISSKQEVIESQGPAILNSFEGSMEASLYNMGYQLDVMMSNSSFSLSLKNLLGNSVMEQKERTFFNVLKIFFSTYESAYSYVHSIYLYLDGKEQFMTSASGQIANIKSYYDLKWYEEYQEMGQDEKIFTSRRWIQRYTYDEPVEVISIYYRNTYINGVIVINIDKSEYGKLLRSILLSEQCKVFLLNSREDIICSTDQNFEVMETGNLLAEKLYQYVREEETHNNTWVKLGEEYYYIYMQHSDYLDVNQISVISLKYLFSEIRYYLILVALVLILDIAIILLLAYSYTKRSFYYIEECLNIFSAAERGERIQKNTSDVKDEYGMILNNIIFMYLRNNQMQLELMEKNHQYEITEMMALQLQINPHFIFNTLQIMDFEIIRNIGVKSVLHKMTQQLSKIVKYALNNPTEEVTLREELDYLRDYLEIQKVRFNNNSITYFEVDESVLDNKVFRLLLQPILENCFEHGLRSNSKNIVIKIKIYDRIESISIAVIDNGIGMSKESLEKLNSKINNKDSKNIGLTNLNQRLILHYGLKSRLIIKSKENMGTIVCFSVPKRNGQSVSGE